MTCNFSYRCVQCTLSNFKMILVKFIFEYYSLPCKSLLQLYPRQLNTRTLNFQVRHLYRRIIYVILRIVASSDRRAQQTIFQSIYTDARNFMKKKVMSSLIHLLAPQPPVHYSTHIHIYSTSKTISRVPQNLQRITVTSCLLTPVSPPPVITSLSFHLHIHTLTLTHMYIYTHTIHLRICLPRAFSLSPFFALHAYFHDNTMRSRLRFCCPFPGARAQHMSRPADMTARPPRRVTSVRACYNAGVAGALVCCMGVRVWMGERERGMVSFVVMQEYRWLNGVFELVLRGIFWICFMYTCMG